ncbi:hypothetical protein AZ16_2511 [Bordetella bronchiseptica B18-5 (C3)]|nr:hypothetical protein AZ16_2511 [Bordetella bronchiseptica B18-5 (C3)]
MLDEAEVPGRRRDGGAAAGQLEHVAALHPRAHRERAAFRALLDLGLTDSFRLFEQPEKSFSWWDYRQFAFRRNAGLRIDHVLLSDALKPHCVACVIDKAPRANEQPSDHAPVIATLAFG